LPRWYLEAVAPEICRLGKPTALAAPARSCGLTWINAAIAIYCLDYSRVDPRRIFNT
jgi:hypothetical protein